MNARADGFAWVGVCMDGPIHVCTQTHAHFLHVCVVGWGGGATKGGERKSE